MKWGVELWPVIVGFLLLSCGEPQQNTTEPDAESDLAPVQINPMAEFGTTASNVFFYYRDVEGATAFYRDTLGLRVAADYGFAKIMQVAPKSFITLVDEQKGMHSAEEPKTTAIALVTDQLDEWWAYIKTQDVAMRSTSYAAVEGKPHDGFVAIDPEGYLLEFERFNAHPENEKLMPVLDATETLYPAEGASNVPPGLGFKATVVWFYYKDMEAIQRFYEDVLGFELIVDQGWTKIYPIGPTGYFGIVDETRGMHRATEDNAVMLSIFTDNVDDWFDYAKAHPEIEMRSDAVSEGDKYRTFVAYDPEGYYLEWDVFLDVPENAALLKAVNAE